MRNATSYSPDEFIRDKCENPPVALDNRTFRAFVPVYSAVNRLTYRNQYCAMCHDIKRYEFWQLIFGERAFPPVHVDEQDLLKFIGSNVRFYRWLSPKNSFLLRYCYFPNVITSCLNECRPGYKRCSNGPVELVHGDILAYKIKYCAGCNNETFFCPVRALKQLLVLGCYDSPVPSITRIIDLRDYGTSEVTLSCPPEKVYDPHVSSCRRTYRPISFNSSENSLKVTMFLIRYYHHRQFFISLDGMREKIAEQFFFNDSQLTDVAVVNFVPGNSEIRISFLLCISFLFCYTLKTKGWNVKIRSSCADY